MRSVVAIVGFVGITALGIVPSAQQPPPQAQQPSAQPARNTQAYQARCGACHGPAMTGGTGPSILSYVRFHTDKDLIQVIREGHKTGPIQVADAELREVLRDLRSLAGTNPLMSTGGYTGDRSGGPPVETFPPSEPRPAAPGIGGMPHTTIRMADGSSRSGILLAQSDLSATLLEAGLTKLTLLSRDGSVYREKAIEPKADWTHYDGSLTGNRYSALTAISASNVDRLGAAWMYRLPNADRILQLTPVVQDGIMYVTGWNELYALDATTGRQLWSYKEPTHPGIVSEAGIGTNRGAAINGGIVSMVTDHAHVLGFDRFTGRRLWEAEMGSYLDSYSATSPPLPVGDLMVVGVAGGEEGARGFLDAYRADTGERVWRWYTIPKRGEPGSETWIGQALDHGCGATWMPGSYDAELDLIYWAIGNPCPDFAGEERLGDNLYTSSVVALEAKTGRLRWYYQFTPHDTHDWDAVQPMLLVDETWQGRPRKLLMHGDRNGIFYVLDRTNGEVLMTGNLSTKVTWLKGFGKDGKPIVDPASVSTREGVAVCPGGGGGANFHAASYNPIARLFYARVSDSCQIYTSHEDPLGVKGNRWFGGGSPTPKARAALAALMKGYQTGRFIRAIDPFTGQKAWDFPAPPGQSGVLSTGSGLLFLGGGGGLLVHDAKTGKPLANVNLSQETQATPMTYMVGGKQYIALSGRGTVTAYAVH
jgi:alcohol dehydrogenase (cytochrome c)